MRSARDEINDLKVLLNQLNQAHVKFINSVNAYRAQTAENETSEKLNRWLTPTLEDELKQFAAANIALLASLSSEEDKRKDTIEQLKNFKDKRNKKYLEKLVHTQRSIAEATICTLEMTAKMHHIIDKRYPALVTYHRELSNLRTVAEEKAEAFNQNAARLSKDNSNNKKRWWRLINMMPLNIAPLSSEWIQVETLEEKYLKPHLGINWAESLHAVDAFQTDIETQQLSNIRLTLNTASNILHQTQQIIRSINWQEYDKKFQELTQTIEPAKTSIDFDSFNDTLHELIKPLVNNQTTLSPKQREQKTQSIIAAFDSMIEKLDMQEQQISDTTFAINETAKCIPINELTTAENTLATLPDLSSIGQTNDIRKKYTDRINFLNATENAAEEIKKIRVEKLYTQLQNILSLSAFEEALNIASTNNTCDQSQQNVIATIPPFLVMIRTLFNAAKTATLDINKQGEHLLTEITSFTGIRDAQNLIADNIQHVHDGHTPNYIGSIVQSKINTARTFAKQLTEDTSFVEEFREDLSDFTEAHYPHLKIFNGITQCVEFTQRLGLKFTHLSFETSKQDSLNYRQVIDECKKMFSLVKTLLKSLNRIKEENIIANYGVNNISEVHSSVTARWLEFKNPLDVDFTNIEKSLSKLETLESEIETLNQKLLGLYHQNADHIDIDTARETFPFIENSFLGIQERISVAMHTISQNIQQRTTPLASMSSPTDNQPYPSIHDIETKWITPSIAAFEALLQTHQALEEAERKLTKECGSSAKLYLRNLSAITDLKEFRIGVTSTNSEINEAIALTRAEVSMRTTQCKGLLEQQSNRLQVVRNVRLLLEKLKSDTLTTLQVIDYNDDISVQRASIKLNDLLSKHYQARHITALWSAEYFSEIEIHESKQWLAAFLRTGKNFCREYPKENNDLPLKKLNALISQFISHIDKTSSQQKEYQLTALQLARTVSTDFATGIANTRSLLDDIKLSLSTLADERTQHLRGLEQYNINMNELTRQIKNYEKRLVLPSVSLTPLPAMDEEAHSPNIRNYQSLKQTFQQHANSFQLSLNELNANNNIKIKKFRLSDEENLSIENISKSNVTFIENLQKKREKIKTSLRARADKLYAFAASFTHKEDLKIIVSDIELIQKQHNAALELGKIPYPAPSNTEQLKGLKSAINLAFQRLTDLKDAYQHTLISSLTKFNQQANKNELHEILAELLRKIVSTLKSSTFTQLMIGFPPQLKEFITNINNLTHFLNNEDILKRLINYVIKSIFHLSDVSYKNSEIVLWSAFMEQEKEIDLQFQNAFELLSNIQQLELPFVTMMHLFGDVINRYEQWNNQFAMPFLAEYKIYNTEHALLDTLENELAIISIDLKETAEAKHECETFSLQAVAARSAIEKHQSDLNAFADECTPLAIEKRALQNNELNKVNGHIFKLFKHAFLYDADVIAALGKLEEHANDPKKPQKKIAIDAFIKALKNCKTHLLDFKNIIDESLENRYLKFSGEIFSLSTIHNKFKSVTTTYSLIVPLQMRLHIMLDTWTNEIPITAIKSNFYRRHDFLSEFSLTSAPATANVPSIVATYHYEQIIKMLKIIHTHQDKDALEKELTEINNTNNDDITKLTAFKEKIEKALKKILKTRQENLLNSLKIFSSGSNLGNELQKCLDMLDQVLASLRHANSSDAKF